MYEISIEGKLRYASIKIEQVTNELPGILFLPHWHHQMEFYRMLEGEMMLTIIDETVHVKSGDIVVVNPNEVHSAERITASVSFVLYQIDLFSLTDNLADIQQKFLNHMFHQRRYFLKRDPVLSTRALPFLMTVEAGWRAGNVEAVESATRLMLVELLRQVKTKYPDQGAYKTYKHTLSQLKPTVSLMTFRYQERITLDILAEMTKVSAIHYSRLFKGVMHYTPIDFLNQVRIAKARQLLLTTELSVGEIAFQTGLRDSNYFSRFFKHYNQMTPTAFRKKYRIS
ncbi:AraC family transcriptional regulator [Fusibacter paucivorans]|uniref:AraC family transcriptional regulator n=1 Tax=Fusibacter paucivorans TaxID=76009 RepID=A0ABS5PMA5_9FIRM|nr:helix-turn-helix domain-containing protein [Fusibacter paucivorans]MBS7526295.1 AraC family transcriptional regulator [Fusibacter paucivorans]